MSLTRREFVAVTAAASYSRILGANDRLRIGVIGCGGMATGHMRGLVKTREQDNTQITAVCDLYQKRLDDAVALTGGKPYKDYREVLNSKDVDYVLNATPEHWHCQITLDAIDAGKHIYCEKPMTKTIEEAKKVVAKLKQKPVKMQVGVQGMSDESYETARKYVEDGTLGKVVVAQIDYSRNHLDDFWVYKTDPDCQPGVNLDWKTWQGTAKKHDYTPERFFSWRRYWDYSSGIASDLFVHRVTRIIKALNLQFPERGVATGGKYGFPDSPAEIPDTFNMLLEYPGGVDVILVSSQANDTPVNHVLRGHKATLEFTRTGFTITPQRLFEKDVKPVTYTKQGAESTELHHRNLQNAIRNGEALKCDATLGYYGVVACQMGVLSFRKRQYMKWDKSGERPVKA